MATNRTMSTVGRVCMGLTLMAVITACAESAEQMSGAALPQEAPPAAVDVDGAALAPAPGASGESEAANPWGALAVPADQAANQVTADTAAEAVDLDASVGVDGGAGEAAADAVAGTVGDAADAAAAAAPDAARAIAAGLPSTGSPAACKTLLAPIDEALRYGGSLILAITMMPANGSYVGYAEGEVKRVTKPVAVGSPVRFALEGNMWQQFSDRIAADDGTISKCAGPCPTPSGPVMPPSVQLFIKNRLDKLGVSMDVATGNTTLTLYSWNNAVVRLTPTCENGMFYGYADGKLYAMTGRLHRPIPTPRPVLPFP